MTTFAPSSTIARSSASSSGVQALRGIAEVYAIADVIGNIELLHSVWRGRLTLAARNVGLRQNRTTDTEASQPSAAQIDAIVAERAIATAAGRIVARFDAARMDKRDQIICLGKVHVGYNADNA